MGKMKKAAAVEHEPLYWSDVIEANKRLYEQLTAVQQLCTEQVLKIRELEKEIVELKKGQGGI